MPDLLRKSIVQELIAFEMREMENHVAVAQIRVQYNQKGIQIRYAGNAHVDDAKFPAERGIALRLQFILRKRRVSIRSFNTG